MPAPELVVVGPGWRFLGVGYGPDRPPDEIEHQADRDLQDHHQEEDRCESLHCGRV
jgi:hypothetical protein